ncbi:hypothetical protein [Nocardia cyriacigeorgica]|nr:hypothetical protein [Nocardia cyriacigeorgica]
MHSSMPHIRTALLGLAPIALAAGVLVAGPATAQGTGLDDYTPIDASRYLVSDPALKGSAFFTTPDGRHCAIYWNNGPAGCDAVPIDAPAGSDQIRTGQFESAHFVNADEPTFTHPEAAVLPEGHKITLGGTSCGVGYQGTVSCAAGPHGFTLAATYSALH